MKRRSFVKQTGLLSVAAFAATSCQLKKMGVGSSDFGLQLWSVRKAMEEDVRGTLKKIAEIGYGGVETVFYDEGKYFDIPVKEFKTILDDLGLITYSGHTRTGYDVPNQKGTMTNEFEMACADAAAMGQKSIVCAYFAEDQRQTLDDYKRHAELFQKCGEMASSYGLQFAHHNHDFEFQPINGQVPYDILLETDSDHVKMEMDIYWVHKAGVSPQEYFERYPGRFPLWHVKDMDDTPAQFFTEVGTGVIDFEAIFAEKEKAGLQYFYIEQDEFKTYSPLKSVSISHDNMLEIDRS